MLNPTRRSHQEKFIEELEHQLEIYQIENDLDRMKISYVNYKLEQINELIT